VLFLKENGFYPAYPNAISYKELLEHLNIGSLEARRELVKLVFVHNLISNKITCPDLLNHIMIRVPNISLRVRPNNINYFVVPRNCSPVYLDSPLISSLLSYNTFSPDLDLALSEANYKQRCREVLGLGL